MAYPLLYLAFATVGVISLIYYSVQSRREYENARHSSSHSYSYDTKESWDRPVTDSSSTVSKRSSAESQSKTCSICLDDSKNNLISTNCKHYFHQTCLATWQKEKMGNRCPCCRSPI